ncbi:D-glucosaminate-6-phosphate ammonia-lyase [Thermoanaerobacter uzonensis DSM 18761]|uniref:D-glucosaminate-6-phosphate ammonia-lyase n=1 Tax=Thermoanaerobacter uzonensis DSM 18761 TaxID=1123369 RepID=A0A1M5AF73_9THEO|nr:DgaE family pyridoxal phosphate-dependent ammonia lyase [Thermoanaerobacter uzonensis]SHF28893.1 D-glucosaminate-6-phosphate ammonia-lyase [Thermoanaerobacter uzonensis DSM 18761]
MSIYQKYGLKQIINASGKMTALGGSAVDTKVAQAMFEAAQDYVDIQELMLKAGRIIAEITTAEDACPTVGAAAGIAISIAALIAGKNLTLIEQLPYSEGLRNEVIIQKGHSINFGASILQMIRLGGGKVVEVGQTNYVEKNHIIDAISEKTVAIFYVKSHHAVQKGMLSLPEIIEIGEENNIPIIVDAAAEEDIQKYIQMGADLVIYSGGKAIEGPTSGFICGKKELIEACRLQYKGIGRAMKVGKEQIMGLISALEIYKNKVENIEKQLQQVQWIVNQFQNIDGITASVVQDEAGRTIYRAQLKFDEEKLNISTHEIIKQLERGEPAIFTRNHYANLGIISIDPRPLLPGQEKIIVNRIKEILRV